MSKQTSSSEPPHDAYAALRVRDFRVFVSGNVIANFGMQMQTVAVGWEIYLRTGSKLALGLVGLVQFVPVILLAVPAGQVADLFDRRRIVMCTASLYGLASAGLVWISASHADYRLMYLCLLVTGLARSFQQPAKASLLPQLVPAAQFTNAVTWSTGGFHLASVVGPAFGGLLIGMTGRPMFVYVLDVMASACFLACLALIRLRPAARELKRTTLAELSAGLGFLRRNQIILGAILLDMFAVLLGGAVTLLPVFAEDILSVGATGLGWLRAAPAIGALAMAFVLAHRPPLAKAGRALLWSVAGFGAATIVFGVSRNFWLSLVMLFLSGALDNISVVVRHTLVQLLTPDHLRGRVSGINSLFIGASNELGGFESGLVAELFSPVISVVSGGVGTIVVVLIAAIGFPRLRRYGRLGSTDAYAEAVAVSPAINEEPIVPIVHQPAATDMTSGRSGKYH